MSDITIYSTPTCPYCKMAKEFLSEKDIKYKDVDVSQDHEAAHQMIEKSGQTGVPVIIVDKDGKEEVMVGFDQAKLSEILGIK